MFWSTRLCAVLGFQIQGATLAWQVYGIARRGHSPKEAALYLGLVGLVQFLPMFLLALPAGVVADRNDRKRIFGICMLGHTLIAASFLGLALVGAPPIQLMFALAFGFGCFRAFIAPASSAMLPMLVPRPILARSIALNSLAFQSGAIVGPSLAGPLIAVAPWLAYACSMGLFIVAAVVSAVIPAATRPEAQTGSRLELMKEGLVYVWRTKIVFGAISLDLVAVLLGGATLLMPAFARDVLHVGAQGFGLMRGAPAVGAGAMALWLAGHPIRRRGGLWMFGCVALFGLATIVFGISKIFWLTLLVLIVLGAADMVSVNVRQTLIQIATPDAMRGRVTSVSMVFISASNELGEFESGVVARLLGPVGAAVFGGVGSLLATGAWAVMFPQLRKADRLT